MGKHSSLNDDLRVELDTGSTVEIPISKILAPPGDDISLKKDFDPKFTGGIKDKSGAKQYVAENSERLSELQRRLYAQDTHAVLIIFQAIDAAGKDGTIRHVLSGVNPQGCKVTSFKAPSAEELDHDYLWRITKALPARGMIGIFNRSHYEEVLVVRVHPEFLKSQKLPAETNMKNIWKRRYEEINQFEKRLSDNGTVILKFFLNLSKEEQRERFLDRINEPDKNWKFSIADHKERDLWNNYQKAFEAMLSNTSTPWAPWYVIPADRKWFARLAVSEAICRTLEQLNPKYPTVSKERKKELLEIKAALEAEE